MKTSIVATPSCGICGTEAFTIRINPDRSLLVCISCGAENDMAPARRSGRQLLSRLVHRLSTSLKGHNPVAGIHTDDTYRDLDVELTEFLERVATEMRPPSEELPTGVSACSNLLWIDAGCGTGDSCSICSYLIRSDR
ncbi:MAG: hypothetical protein V3R87_01840 [Dehalococcoidia bacterium]